MVKSFAANTFFNYDSHYEFPEECLNVSRWPGDIRASPMAHPHRLGDNIRGSHSFSAPSSLSSKHVLDNLALFSY